MELPVGFPGDWQQKLHDSQRELTVCSWGLLARKTALRPRGWPANDLYTIYELSWLMGSGRPAHEHCTISKLSCLMGSGRPGHEHCAISEMKKLACYFYIVLLKIDGDESRVMAQLSVRSLIFRTSAKMTKCVLVSVYPICAISLVSCAGEVSGLCSIFEGIQSWGDCRVWFSGWPTWELFGLLAGSATWKD